MTTRRKKNLLTISEKEFFSSFSKFTEKISANKKYPLKAIAEAFEAFLEDVSAEEKIELLSESFEAAGDKKSADNLKRSFKTVLDLIDVVKEIIGDEKVNLKEFYGILEAGLSKSDLGFVPPENDLVVIGDLERTRLNDIKVLFVLGMNEGIIPKAPEPMGIFSDTESEFFESIGAELTKTGKRAAFEENFLILMGLSQPSDILRLSYSTSDLKGSELRPSIIINKIKRIFPQIEVSSSEKYKDEISLAEPALHKLSNKLSAGEELSPSWEYVLNYALKDENFKGKVQNMLKAKEDSSFEENISKEKIGKLFGKRLNLSATGINLYSGCPFSYFVKYGLKAKERDVYEIKNPDLGSIFHSVLERFSNELSEDKISWADISKVEMEGRIERAVEDIAPAFSEKILLSKAGYRYLIKRLKKISKRAIWALSYHAKKGAFKPLGFEIGFGKGEALPPIIIKLDSGRELLMRGKIDRVDVFEKDGNSYVKIIDYKTSGKNFDLMSVYYGIELQLMLYMAEFAEAGNEILENEIIPGGIFYFAVKSGDMIPEETKTTLTADEIAKAMLKNFKMNGLILADNNVIDALDSEISGSSDIIPVRVNKDGSLSKTSGAVSKEEFLMLLDYSKEKVKEIGEDIYSGKISPSPYKINEKSACTFCQYRSVCRFDSGKKADNFRILKKLKDKEVIELIKEKTEG